MKFFNRFRKSTRPLPMRAGLDEMAQLSGEDIAGLPLIMDIGMNNGRDSLFYLKKGFRVVAVEANPLLVEKACLELAEFIESGQLVIEALGLTDKPGEFTFYQNLDNDHWSSFRKDWGTRERTRYREIVVSGVPPHVLFERHGVPYYLKIDIEGHDIDVVRALYRLPRRPRYLSIEEHEAHYFAELWSLGYRHFKLVNQRELSRVKCPYPAREGNYVGIIFDDTTSGPFGEETPGSWKTFEQIMHQYLTEVRSPLHGFLAGNAWFDIHARLG